MSYDLHLFRPRADVDLLRAGRESYEAGEGELAPGPPDPEGEQRKLALAEALRRHDPELDVFSVRSGPESPGDGEEQRSSLLVMVSTPDEGVLFTLHDAAVSVFVLYWYDRDAAEAVWEAAWSCLAVLEREGGFRTYDPQLGRILDLGADRPAVVEKYLQGVWLAPEFPLREVEERVPWWRRLSWRVEEAVRAAVGLTPSEAGPRLRNRRAVSARLAEVARGHAASHPEVSGRTETVTLRMVVRRDGAADRVEVVSTGCDPALAEEAARVGAGMRFRPARIGSTPTAVLITIPVTLQFPG